MTELLGQPAIRPVNEGLEAGGLLAPPCEQIMCRGCVWCADLGRSEQQRVTQSRREAKERLEERVSWARGCGQPNQSDVQLAERLYLPEVARVKVCAREVGDENQPAERCKLEYLAVAVCKGRRQRKREIGLRESLQEQLLVAQRRFRVRAGEDFAAQSPRPGASRQVQVVDALLGSQLDLERRWKVIARARQTGCGGRLDPRQVQGEHAAP